MVLDTEKGNEVATEAFHISLQRYGNALRSLHESRKHPRDDFEREWKLMHFMIAAYYVSRSERIDDLLSPEVRMANDIARSLYPVKGFPFSILCIDGRLHEKFITGLDDSSIRLPAGESESFVPEGKEGMLLLEPGSWLARFIDAYLTEHHSMTFVFDSHVTCAKRQEEEQLRHRTPVLEDNGLFMDVVLKKQMGKAVERYVTKYHPGKSSRYIQTSFDPNTGYLYMGLERCLRDPRVISRGFSSDVLALLKDAGKIFATADIAKSPLWKDALEAEYFRFNYKRDYRNSSLHFWQGMQRLATKERCKVLEDDLFKFFHYQNKPRNELRQRALIIIANMLNGCVLNREERYPYHAHDESMIVVTNKERGPFSVVRSFPITTEVTDLSSHVALAYKLITNNRGRRAMSSTERRFVEELYGDSFDAMQPAPVPLIHGECIDEATPDLELIRCTDWSDLASSPWMRWSNKEFSKYLRGKIPYITLKSAEVFELLRQAAIALYRRGLAATRLILEGYIIPFWVVIGPDGKIVTLVPFLAIGY